MYLKGTVRLKALLLLLLTFPCLLSSPTTGIPESDRETRLEAEKAEKDWVNTLVSKVDDADTQANTTTTLKADVKPVVEEKRPQKSTVVANGESKEQITTIECAAYDETECEKNGKCEITKMTCSAEKHLKTVGCLAIFTYNKEWNSNSTEKYLPVERKHYKSLGCMQYQHSDWMSCVDNSDCLQGRAFRSGIGMCCCQTPNCNSPEHIYMQNTALLKKDMDPSKGSLYWLSTPPTGFDELGSVPVYWLITIFLAFVIFIITCIVIYIVWGKYQKKKQELKNRKCDMEKTNVMEAGHLPLVDHAAMIEMVETPKELPITEFQLISKGRFGRVFKAIWTSENGDTHFVAVKKLNDTQKGSYDAEKRIFEELVSFPKWYTSIVQFTCAEKIGNEYWIVTEFHERLSLYELLKHNIVSKTSAARIIMSMIDGLQFLHDDRPYFFGHSKKPIIHRDIKSKNILVKSDMTTCIADFGLARIYDFDIEQSDLLGQVGTKRYMSPEMLEGATEFTATAFKAMDVYSMGLVMWEVISRTKLTENDHVPDYQMPFQSIGYDPSIGIMRNHVVSKKERPHWRPDILTNDYMSLMARVTEEMWDPEACARITAGCAFARIWNHVMSYSNYTMNLPESSEGYHSGSSLKDKEDGEEEESINRNPKEIDEMLRYHASPSRRLHPSPNPMNDRCPPPPPIPLITDQGIIHHDKPDAEPIQDKNEDQPVEETPMVEKVFDLAMNRLFTREEHDRLEAQEYEEDSEINTRASTPTPSGTF